MTAIPDSTTLIRRVTVADIPVLSQLGAATFVEAFGANYAREDLERFLADAYSEDAYRKLITDAAIRAWLAETHEPVGFLVAGSCKLPVPDLEPGAGEIRQLYVRAAAQRRQLGTQLLGIALEWLEASGSRPLYVGVWSKNPGAQRLYARFGFRKVGEYDFPVGRHIDREYILRRG
jgi:ribosomal protein S18 acetylase RimI-like enzyme